MVRPSYVLGGRAMEIVYDEQDLRRYFQTAVSVSTTRQCWTASSTTRLKWMSMPSAMAKWCWGGGIGAYRTGRCPLRDSTCSPASLYSEQRDWDVMREQVQKLAFELQVRGLMNVQFAVKITKSI